MVLKSVDFSELLVVLFFFFKRECPKGSQSEKDLHLHCDQKQVRAVPCSHLVPKYEVCCFLPLQGADWHYTQVPLVPFTESRYPFAIELAQNGVRLHLECRKVVLDVGSVHDLPLLGMYLCLPVDKTI